MKKVFAFLCVLWMVLIWCFPMYASAHPGRTDGNGGHTDKSTGEYHYHHGYSAHDHWDMNGDGIIDCPYNFDDQTNHNSGNSSGNGTGVNNQNFSNNHTHKAKETNKTYSYIAIGFVIAFFVFVNCFAIHIDKTDNSDRDEPISIPSALISIIATVIVFAILFFIMYLHKQPIQLMSISFTSMMWTLFLSALFGGLVWLFSNWASCILNMLLCSLFKLEAYYGWAGAFQRLTIPLSYAFTVLLFITQ